MLGDSPAPPAASSSSSRVLMAKDDVDAISEIQPAERGQGDIESLSTGSSAGSEFEFGVDYGKRGGTLLGTISNACNTIVGAGVLALPSTIAETGYVSGILLFLLGAALSQFGLHLLFVVMDHLGGDQLSFGRVAGRINRFFPLLASLLVWLICFAVSVLYLNVTADFLVPVAMYFASLDGEPVPPDAWYLQRIFWLTLPFLTIAAPLSVPKKMTVLQYTSALAMLFIFYTAFVVVVYAFKPIEEVCAAFLARNNAEACFGDSCCVSDAPGAECCVGEKVAFTSSFSKFVQAFPVIITAFCCSPQAFAFYNDMQRPTLRRLNTATGSALSLVIVLYLIVSMGGYFTYGANVKSDLLGSYPLTLEVTIARMGVAFLTTVSFPLLLQPCRDATVQLVSDSWLLATGKEIGTPRSKSFAVLFYVSLVLMLATTYALGTLGLDISLLLNLGGSLSVANLSFTLPGVFYLCIIPHEGMNRTRVLACGMIAIGLFIMIFNIVLWAMGA